MHYVKQLSVALLALGLSAPVLAKQLYAEPMNQVLIPSQHGGFKVSIDSLYLRNNAVTNLSDTSYDLGWYGQVGYLFPATPNDLTLAYTYLRADNNDTMDVDTIDIEGGQRLTAGALDMRLFAGMRYSHLNYSFDNVDTSVTSKFHGIGPRLGADVRYNIGSGFGLDTHLNTALLAGTTSSKYQNQKEIFSNSVNGIVPHVGAKLGMDYTYCVPGDSKSALVFEVGYQTDHHFKAIDSSADVSFDGAYLDIKYYN
jgi:hypothetical protein